MLFVPHQKPQPEPENDVPNESSKEEVSESSKEEVQPFCDQCDSKGVRHKKSCPTKKQSKSEESSFEGLKE